ncbi:hypothetical protein [Mycolicibacterium vanbaalenii]|nr:hypothetical protein [Mycolicibacterium vanbaalenii]
MSARLGCAPVTTLAVLLTSTAPALWAEPWYESSTRAKATTTSMTPGD